jgi:uncharacterized membrane protein HdeD (DUF308 family)
MDGLKICGIISLCLAGLMGYWLSTPSEALKNDPGNSLILIIFAASFVAAGVFLIFFSYMFNQEED